MSDLPCKNYIRFLASFAPTMGNGGAIEEVRSAHDAHDGHQQADYTLQFDNGVYDAYAAHLETLIREDKSRVLVIHGQAGDGKTNLLYRFFREKLGYDLGNRETSLEDSSTPHSYHHIKLPDVSNEIYYVLDMSELRSNKEDAEYQQVLNDIFDIVIHESEPTEQGPHKIVILAINNGILLDSLEKIADLHSQHVQWQEQIVKPLRQHFLGKLQSLFISQSNEEESNGNSVLQLFSVDDVIKNKEPPHLSKKKVQQSGSARLILFDMSARIDYATLGRIIDEFFKEEVFAQCKNKKSQLGLEEGCAYLSFCPLRKNYELLRVNNYKVLKDALSKLIDLQSSNGYHINARTVLSLLSNTLLGCVKVEQFPERQHLDCEIIDDILRGPSKNAKLSKQNKRMECCYLPNFYDDKTDVAFVTNPYDNIFGLNLNLRHDTPWNAQNALLEDVADELNNDQYHVFRIMCKTGLGDYSNIHVDGFIKKLLKKDKEALSAVEDNFVVMSLLDALRKRIKEEDDLSEDVEQGKNNKKYQQTKQERYAITGSLRRALFFCLQAQLFEENQESQQLVEQKSKLHKDLTQSDLFAVSAFPHALKFLDFWQSFVTSGNQLVKRKVTRQNSKLDDAWKDDSVEPDKQKIALSLSQAMDKFLSGQPCKGNENLQDWALFEGDTDNCIVLNVRLHEAQLNKPIKYVPSNDPTFALWWYFMASEDSLHLPQFVCRKKSKLEAIPNTNDADEEDDDCDDNDLQQSSYEIKVVTFPITALNFETLMQIYDGALVFNFTKCLSDDLQRFKDNLLVLQQRT